jgi:trehalose 6-phosphate synthase
MAAPLIFRSIAWKVGLPLVLAVAAVTYLAVPHVDRVLTEWFRADIEMRANLVMQSIEEGLPPLLDRSAAPQIRRYIERLTADERLLAVLICGPKGEPYYKTEPIPTEVACPPIVGAVPIYQLVSSAKGMLHVARFPLARSEKPTFGITIVHDLSFIDRRQRSARDYMIAFIAVAALISILLAATSAWLILRSWVLALIRDIRNKSFSADLGPSRVARDQVLSHVRQALREVEYQQRMEVEFRENWTAEALRHIVTTHLDASQLMVISNREPYIHNRNAGRVVVQYPASGMVTALEPIVRACSGVWIAHGSGSADKDVVDLFDRVPVPPEDPQYTLRRVWLTAEEEQGYYFGFANEGMWPLCHLAYVRPKFRLSDWEHYRTVNRRFAATVAKEAKRSDPIVLVQDYHFALLPQYVREQIPNSMITLFWHIPWPSAETFGICPWRQELLKGMLQADIIGFHTRYHCQNFLATVDRFLEAHVDQEHSTVTIQDHVCRVAPYPISIEWPPRWLKGQLTVAECRAKLIEELDIAPDSRIGLGVERWDFTKGIVDRLLALEVLLENEPQLRGKLVFVQIAAPTRSSLEAYKELQVATQQTTDRINARFGTETYKPIVLVPEHRDPYQVFELYRGCDFCIVNSLHDGMNLVAKEFVAARDDEDGVLILSTFAGASRELVEALIVNPYDVDETAHAISHALRLTREERQERMRLMRQTVKESNVFRWAGRMLMDVARVRQRRRLAPLSVDTRATRYERERSG